MAKTYQQLQAQMAALEKQAEAARTRELKKVIQEIKQQVALYGLTADDLGLGEGQGAPTAKKQSPATSKRTDAKSARVATKKASGKKASKKLAKPNGFADEAGNTWSGRGPRPRWFKDALGAGKSPDDLRA